jgi:hypothetical protein
MEAIEARRLHARRGHRARARLRRERVLRQGDRSTPSTRSRDPTAEELVDHLRGWCEKYPLVSIEDGCAEDDWDTWKLLTDASSAIKRAARGRRPLRHQRRAPRARHRGGIANSILVKVNQIGTVTETLDHPHGAPQRLPRDHLAPLGRDRGHLHRRPRGRHQRGPDQDRLGEPHRPRREVQPAPAHR